MQRANISNDEATLFSEDWKLLITYGSKRTVHARGCDYIKDWSIDGTEELRKLKPEKHYMCPICAGLSYASIGAKDYVQNIAAYKRLFLNKDTFGGVPTEVLRDLYYTNKGKTYIRGNKLYIHVKQDDWYIDTEYGQVKLYHNNYRVSDRERGKNHEEPGYHEHFLQKGERQPLATAIKSIIRYNFDEAEKAHKKKRNKRPKMTFSEYDPESWGFDS